MKQTCSFPVILLMAMLSLFTSSCKKEESKSRLTIYLTDAPALYDAVNVDVKRVEIKVSGDQGDDGWQVIPLMNPGVYNLLDFTNGKDTIIASQELPAGRISQIRLILGDNNSLVLNGTTSELPLETPSAQTSGLKFNVHADLKEGVEYKIWIDFNAAKSIVVTGSNEYKLKPVIRTFTEATSGAIKGTVLPLEAQSLVHAISGTDTLSAIPDPVTGKFLVRGVPAGTWKIWVDGFGDYQDQTIENISVSLGQVTDIQNVVLEK